MNVESRPYAAAGRLAIMVMVVVVSGTLSGCALTMLEGASRSGSATATGGGGSATGRPASRVAADQAISSAVRSRLRAHASLEPLNLIVSTHDGVVTLRGQVHNVQQRTAAQLEAGAVKGVKAVKNELTVR